MEPLIAHFSLPPDHPCLPGHFPGMPIVPGVVLLDQVMALAAPLLPPGPPTLTHVRFLAPVPPDTTVRLSLTGTAGGGIGFTGHVGETLVLRGELRGPAAAP